MSVTFLLRHAQSTYSARYRLNGDPSAAVPLTPDGETACMPIRAQISADTVATCIASPFPRCVRTAELVMTPAVPIVVEPLLGELDYGVFEGEPFVSYARWLAEHGPNIAPPGARESQSAGIGRMVSGLGSVVTHPGPRVVVAHGLLWSLLRHSREQPRRGLYDVFLPSAPHLVPLVFDDEELTALTTNLATQLADRCDNPAWLVDLRVFPKQMRGLIATAGD